MTGLKGWSYVWPLSGKRTYVKGRPWTRCDVDGVAWDKLAHVWDSPMLAGITPEVMEILIDRWVMHLLIKMN